MAAGQGRAEDVRRCCACEAPVVSAALDMCGGGGVGIGMREGGGGWKGWESRQGLSKAPAFKPKHHRLSSISNAMMRTATALHHCQTAYTRQMHWAGRPKAVGEYYGRLSCRGLRLPISAGYSHRWLERLRTPPPMRVMRPILHRKHPESLHCFPSSSGPAPRRCCGVRLEWAFFSLSPAPRRV